MIPILATDLLCPYLQTAHQNYHQQLVNTRYPMNVAHQNYSQQLMNTRYPMNVPHQNYCQQLMNARSPTNVATPCIPDTYILYWLQPLPYYNSDLDNVEPPLPTYP